jgi:hypothetical protein
MKNRTVDNLLFASRIAICLAAAGTAFAAFSSNAMADSEPGYPVQAPARHVVVPAHPKSFSFDIDHDGAAPFEARYIKAALQMSTDADGGFAPTANRAPGNRSAASPVAQNAAPQQVAGLFNYLRDHKEVVNAPVRHEQS